MRRLAATRNIEPVEYGLRVVVWVGNSGGSTQRCRSAKARLNSRETAEVLRVDAAGLIDAVSELPDVVGALNAALEADPNLREDVFGTALRLEQPLREIAETADEASGVVHDGPVSTLTEQSRMHPVICGLVSDTFYEGRLTTVARIADRASGLLARERQNHYLRTWCRLFPDRPAYALDQRNSPAWLPLVGVSANIGASEHRA